MVSVTINDLDESLEQRLRMRAAQKGVSVEQEARNILAAALRDQPPPHADLASSIRSKFAPFGGVELELPARDAIRPTPHFD